MGLKSWLRSLEHVLPLRRTWAWLPATHGSKLSFGLPTSSQIMTETIFFFILVFQDGVSLCNSPGCPGTRFVDQPGLKPQKSTWYRDLLVMNAQSYLMLVPLALITYFNLFLFTYVLPQGFHSVCPTLCLGGWPRVSSSLSLSSPSLEPKFPLLFILSVHSPSYPSTA